MDENTKKIIKERFDDLPKSIQEIILSSNYQETLIELGKKYQLNVEQLSVLEMETTLVMMGLTPTEKFEAELTRELNVDKLKGNQITQEVNEKIFLKIRELLKLMSESTEDKPSTNTQKSDSRILDEAGIKIIPPTPSTQMQTEKLEIPAENREEILKKIEKPEEIHPILMQKLSGSVQTEMVKTDHSVPNLTPSNPPSASLKKIDPYREIPE